MDGGAAQTLDTRGLGLPSGKLSAGVHRLAPMAAGAHTAVVTWPAGTAPASVFFDCWQIESPIPPLVLLVKQPLVSAAALSVYPAGARPTDASIQAMNAMLDDLAAEFTDGMVKTVDASYLDNQASLMQSDGLHPNEQGHALIAAAARRVVLSAGLTVDQMLAAS